MVVHSTIQPFNHSTIPPFHYSTIPPMKFFAILAVVLLAACSSTTPETQPEPQAVGARLNDKLEGPIAPGDCHEATKRARANPNIDVEKVASPLKVDIAPIGGKRMPKGVADRNGWYTVKFHVVVDTTGKADMKTFAIDTTSHPWLATSIKSAVAKWKFAPAEVAGCKIPRNYSLGITPRGKTPAVTKPAARKKAPAKSTTKKPPAA
jgi:hypothetical protein